MFEIKRPQKDTTIYGYAKKVNAGIDEILELNTDRNEEENYEPSRVLIKFPKVNKEFSSFLQNGPNVFASYGYETVSRNPTGEQGTQEDADKIFNVTIEQAINNSSFGEPNTFAFFGQQLAPEREEEIETPDEKMDRAEPTAWLRLWFAEGQGLPKDYIIEAVPVQERWKEGSGRFQNKPRTLEPANWTDRTDSEKWNTEGGDFEMTPRSAERFKYEDPDVYMDVNAVLSENLENGLLLKRRNEDVQRKSNLRFFSKNTRTIYVPQLLIGTDEYQFNTKDANPVEEENFTAYVSNMNRTYSQSKVRFDVSVEEKYEQKDFLGKRPTENYSPVPTYLPKRSLTWKIEDVVTGLAFFPFDENYSAVSFDGDTHYFDVDLTNLFPKREYKVILKYTDPETGREQIFDHNQTFKVTDGA